MKRFLFSLFFFALLPGTGLGQTVLDSASVVKQVDSLIQVCRTLSDQREFDQALEVMEATEKLVLEKLGRETAVYGSTCSMYGWVLFNKFQYPEAEKWYLEAKDIQAKVLGKGHLHYATTLSRLAFLYLRLDSNEKAEALYLEALAIREIALGREHPSYCDILNKLAWVYENKGQYEKSETFYLQSKEIFEVQLKDKEHHAYMACLNNLALLYFMMGNYEKAEALYLEVKAIRGKISGIEHPEYGRVLHNLSLVYAEMGNYEKSEALLVEAKTIRGKALGKEDPDYAESVVGLAMLYDEIGNFESAEALYLENKAILEKSVGRESHLYAGGLGALGEHYMEMGDYKKAEPLLLEALAIDEKIFGNQHPYYAGNLQALAYMHKNLNNFEKAALLSSAAKTIQEKVLGKETRAYHLNARFMADLYRAMGNYEEAEPLYDELSHLNQSMITKALHHLSEREMNTYLITFSATQNQILSFVQTPAAKDLSTVRTAYNNTLFHKGFLLNAYTQVKRLVLSDSVSTEKFNLLKSYERRLAAEYANPIAERDSINVGTLETEANDLEKDLARSIAGYGEAMQQVKWQEVQQHLQPGEAAIEFVHYRLYRHKETDSTIYAALILRPGWAQPRMVNLFEQRDIQPLLAAANTAALVGQLYATRGSKKGEGIVIPGQKMAGLYQLLWAPIDSLLSGATTIYYAPSGLLHRLHLGAVALPGTNQVLADRYALVQLGSTRALAVGTKTSARIIAAKARPPAGRVRTAALFGGLRYDAPTAIPAKPATDSAQAAPVSPSYDVAALRSALGDRGGNAWNYLAGTEKEVKNVSTSLKKAGYSVRSLGGHDGTEAAFKMLGSAGSPAPAVLHIATHGFFFPDPKDTTRQREALSDRDPVFKTSDNPLLRSGLVLAGANHAWAGGSTPNGQEDGILTAYEISQMNLAGTELVVLSACETGLGDVDDNEGVYGLKRAFKIAGAKYLIMSLWQVPDKQTQELMSAFYQNWLGQKKTIPVAFAAAQRNMRKQYDDPFFWAGFVLVE